MSFCTITCDRGDRKQFMDFCRHQIDKLTVKPDKSYFIDWPPQTRDFDLVTRFKDGIHQALKDGFNEVYVLESDDFYSPDYFEKMQLGDAEFIGEEKTTYYNLRNKSWQTMHHSGRSSLFITGFKLSALKDFKWPRPNERSLDIALWAHAKYKLKKFVSDTGAIGIKHALGKFAGRGHIMTMKNSDPEMEYLKSKVDNEAYCFYKSLNL